MGIKLVASDLDGTLFTDEKTISDETRRTLEEVTGKGILFVPCTGRAFASVPEAGADASWRSVYDRIKWSSNLPCGRWRADIWLYAFRRFGGADSGASDVGGDDIRSTDSGTVLYGAALH